MSTVRLRSLDDSPDKRESNSALSAYPSEASQPENDDALPEDWQSLSENAPARVVPHVAARPTVSADSSRNSRRIVIRALFAALLVAALAEGVVIARLLATRTAPAQSVEVPVAVTIGSVTPGEPVVIDGRQVGVTPYVVTVDRSMREIRVVGESRPAPVEPSPVPQPIKSESSPTLTATPPRSGGMKLSSPIEVQVVEGDRVLGSSAEGAVVAKAGVHQFELVNSELGYRERRQVEIKAGQIVTVTVTPPNGRLNVNAVPWAQVTIDGRDAGETPLANLALPVGAHDLVFQHPQFGQRTEHVIVKAGALTRVSVTMGR